MLLGLAAPTSGRALVFGQPYAQIEDPIRRVGAVLEATDFHPGRSGRDHLRMLAEAVALPRSRVEEVLGLVELQEAARRNVKTYSLGMRQRLGLAAALLGDPELLILDEPANGLDPGGVRWLRDFLRDYAAGQRTVLISSHVLAEVAQTVDQVLIINHGKLVTESSLGRAHRPRRRIGSHPHAADGEAHRSAEASRYPVQRRQRPFPARVRSHGRAGRRDRASRPTCRFTSSPPTAPRWRRSSSD